MTDRHDTELRRATCAGCGGQIVECSIEHGPADLCRGWRHDLDDPVLSHSIVCATSSTRDDRGWWIAGPATR